MKNLDEIITGKYKVTTQHGTYYIVDLDNKQFKRVKADGRNELNGDNDWVPFIADSGINVGEPMFFEMFPSRRTGGDSWRMTTLVSSIEEWNE